MKKFKRVPRLDFSIDDEQRLFSKTLRIAKTYADPVEWIQKQLGVELFSNQIEIIEAVFDPAATNINILGSRGSGKSQGLAYALTAICSTTTNQHVICAGPIEKQASRLIRYVKEVMKAKSSKVKDLIDWQASSALRLVWRNGNTIVGVSGQEKASVEGEHGNILVVDEAHLVPGYSLSSKLGPMLMGIGKGPKLIKLGVAMGRNHFFRSYNAKGARNCFCKWSQSEIHLEERNPLFYRKKQVSRQLLAIMPVKYKQLYFPDRPDLFGATGQEISILDWQTQYELEWVEDINNFLSEEDHAALASGKHEVLTSGNVNGARIL